MHMNEEEQERMLKAAHSLFSTKGFSGTSVKEIAGQAEVSEVSAARTYPSLMDLFIDSFSEGFIQQLETTSVEVHPLTNQKPAEMIYTYLWNRMKEFTSMDKSVFREMMNSLFPAMENDAENRRKMIGIDFMLVDEMIVLLNDMKEKKLLSEGFNANQAAEIIYSSLAFEFLLYVYEEEVSLEIFLDGVKKKLDFIIER
ncbi:TetR family transcriptional regulator [Halobacillus litoralis]|uniref:TetR family transcriptional regulator n=1 Tax=Halobacillus litoralis TaxID=45668 RepID=UPI001CD384C6|nr:TetR family transcriptional regulator [Halobacillus litoralis]MCA1024195.1 TetR family transcriptional regulator [Halobacillus litoralis]